MKYKFILFEGIDGSGKTTLSKACAKALEAVYLSSPPKSIRFLKRYMDSVPVSLRHLYYSFGNILSSVTIKKMLKTTHVVCDQYIYIFNCLIPFRDTWKAPQSSVLFNPARYYYLCLRVHTRD